MKRFWIGLGALTIFVSGVSLVAYNTGLLVSEASSIDEIIPSEGLPGLPSDTGAPTPINAPLNLGKTSTGSQFPTGGAGAPAGSSSDKTLNAIEEAKPVTLKSFVNENFVSLDQILTVGVPQLLINFAGLVTLVMFLIYAIKFLFSAGNETGTTDAKQGMLFAGIGFAVVMLAFAIVQLADNIFK